MKTENGEYVSFYECTPEAVVEEFALLKREYEHITGRRPQRGVIAYMIRQSFKPGEIEAKEANSVGYELAMRFTKGKHMFFVATHIDRDHVHNHIIFNSTTLDCTRKFKNFFLSGRAVQKLSDLICIENSLSVIEPKPHSERIKMNRYKDSVSKRDIIRKDIELALLQKPKNLEEILKILSGKGYEVKYGKHIAVKKKEDKRFLRLDSLGPGYTHWAKVFNVKQMAQTILFLQEHDFESFEQLDKATNETIKKFHEVSAELKYMEKQIGDSKELKKQIINYSKTRDVYVEYRKAGYSKKFLEAHREEIEMHKATKELFDRLGGSKIPRVKELNQ